MPASRSSLQRPEVALPAPPNAGFWDRLGILISGACVVHCLLLPVLLAVLPLLPFGHVLHDWMHPVFAVLLVPTTLFAMVSARRHHANLGVQLLLGVGMLVVIGGGMAGHVYAGNTGETLVTVAGSAMLIAGHWKNWRLCATCSVHAHHQEGPHLHAAGHVCTPAEAGHAQA